MAPIQSITLPGVEGRFARLEAIEWWKQSLLRDARVLVIGAGALGNEVIKNLALLGTGHVVITDMDRVELSNLSRSVLFRAEDEGLPKAACAARAAARIYPEMEVLDVEANVLGEVGLGYFRWAHFVIGALDNREARVFVNSACARVGRPWFDGAIEALHGIVRGFAPPATACYECTMSTADWDLLNKRRSCSLLARRALAAQGTPTTPTTASVIAAMQVQEMVKAIHGMATLMGRGFVFDGAGHSSYLVSYPINPDCPWHEQRAEIIPLPACGSDTPLRKVWEMAESRLGKVDAIDLSREVVRDLVCPACGNVDMIFKPLEKIDESQARCSKCGAESVPAFFHSLDARGSLLDRTPRQLGLPAWDIVWARNGQQAVGFEFSGDSPFAEAKTKPTYAR
jgi:molybdopterin/thiamine biosynthesis adenylyltransferase